MLRAMDSFTLDTFRAFRSSLYDCLHRRADALFELTDALLTAEAVPSPVHLSLQPSHRRGWGSLYNALSSGLGLPVHCAKLNFVRESWTAPVDVERVRPAQDTNEVAAEQVRAFLRLSRPQARVAPLFVFDAGYNPVKLQQGLEGCWAQILVRLRAGRCFYADPSLAGPPAPTGRPRRHGPKMKCADPSTWPKPSTEYTCEDSGATGSCECAPGRSCTRRSVHMKVAEARGLCP